MKQVIIGDWHLIHENGDLAVSGQEFDVGDGRLKLIDGTPPHKPSSTGRVNVIDLDDGENRSYYPSVIGLKWVKRISVNTSFGKTSKKKYEMFIKSIAQNGIPVNQDFNGDHGFDRYVDAVDSALRLLTMSILLNAEVTSITITKNDT